VSTSVQVRQQREEQRTTVEREIAGTGEENANHRALRESDLGCEWKRRMDQLYAGAEQLVEC